MDWLQEQNEHTAYALAMHREAKNSHPTIFFASTTDVEARPPATAVIGFGGNVERESVVRDADWFVYDFDKMVEAATSSSRTSQYDLAFKYFTLAAKGGNAEGANGLGYM